MIGGLDIYIRNSITHCKDESFEFVIVCGRDDKHQPVTRNGKEIPEYHISLYRSLNPFHDLLGLFQTIRCIVREKPDVIHCHSAKGGIIGRLAGWITGKRTFYTAHAFSFLCTPSKIKRNIFKAIERFTKMNAYLLACSESERLMGINDVKYKEERALVWHNAVPQPAVSVKTTDKETQEAYACYIGRPCYQKNTLFLADVIRLVKERGCPLKFILLGVGYYSSDLEELKMKIAEEKLENTIFLKPWIAHDECLDYVKNSLFYITTSRYEGLPLSVIEAMGLGKAVIASDVVGNNDCVTNNVNGFTLPLDATVFADKIMALWNNPQLRLKFEEASEELFKLNFHIDSQIGKLHAIYTMDFS